MIYAIYNNKLTHLTEHRPDDPLDDGHARPTSEHLHHIHLGRLHRHSMHHQSPHNNLLHLSQQMLRRSLQLGIRVVEVHIPETLAQVLDGDVSHRQGGKQFLQPLTPSNQSQITLTATDDGIPIETPLVLLLRHQHQLLVYNLVEVLRPNGSVVAVGQQLDGQSHVGGGGGGGGAPGYLH